MLVLTRKTAERLLIGDNITLTIVRIDGNKVRIGIEAPPDVTIHREEVIHKDQGVLKSRELSCVG